MNDGAVKSDMLLSLCRNLMQQRPNLKLILFSSKPNVGNLVGYFERRQLSVGTVNNKISTTYPVSEIYLKDIINDTLQGEELDEHSKAYCKAELSAPSGGARHEMVIEDHTLSEVPFNLVRKLILRICSSNPQGNILVFLPGITEIERLYTMLENDDVKMTKIFALHEKKDRDIMKYAFSSVKKGYRKIVLATDAVEMNLTIPGVAHVIDTGRQQIMLYSGAHRMTRRDMCRLPSDRLKYRVARAAAVEGGCYYGIYNKEMHHNITSQQTNEILHTDVDQANIN